jgi:hypothetical protein
LQCDTDNPVACAMTAGCQWRVKMRQFVAIENATAMGDQP